MSFKGPLETPTEKLLEARDRADQTFELVASYLWPVDPMLKGLEPLRAADLAEDDRRKAALEELERDQEAREVSEFRALRVIRDPQTEDEE